MLEIKKYIKQDPVLSQITVGKVFTAVVTLALFYLLTVGILIAAV